VTRTILVVDDEHDLAATCERLLHRRGWNVVTAGSREAALTALARTPRPVLAIVDRQLPDGDGLDVLRAALAIATPVIIVTGYGSAATRRLALDEGAAGFLAKPFSSHELLELVRGIVGEASGPAAARGNLLPAPDQPRPGIHCSEPS
jgi:DNA-binding response OmpR family regulator